MEFLILLLIAFEILIVNIGTLAVLCLSFVRFKEHEKAAREPEKTPEQLAAEKEMRERQEKLDEGFANMMNYTGEPERSDG